MGWGPADSPDVPPPGARDGEVGRRELIAGALACAGATVLPRRAVAAASGADEAARLQLDAARRGAPAAGLSRLAALPTIGLSPRRALDVAAAREGLAIDARLAQVMPFGRAGRSPYVVTALWGAWREAGAPDAAARIEAETTRIERDGAAGVVLPRPLLDRTVTAVRAAATGASANAGAAMMRQAAALDALRPVAREAAGIGALPHGRAAFMLLLDRQFGEARDGEAVHRLFLAEAEALRRRADDLLARLGYRQGDVAARFRAAFADPRYLYPDDDAGRDRAVADMNRTLGRAKAVVPRLIGPVPPECLNVSAARMSAAEVAAGKGGYRVLPRADGTAGRYVVDLADIHRRPSWSLGSVVLHELVPGHMIQMPMEARAAPHPLRLDYATAYQEGWAIFAEQLAAADQGFAGDDLMQLGHAHWLLFRIGRALVDTGVHLGGWTVAEARQKLEGMMGVGAYFASIDTDIDRICLEPAVRAGEALAWLALRDDHAAAGLRGRAQPFLAGALVDGRLRRSQLTKRAA